MEKLAQRKKNKDLEKQMEEFEVKTDYKFDREDLKLTEKELKQKYGEDKFKKYVEFLKEKAIGLKDDFENIFNDSQEYNLDKLKEIPARYQLVVARNMISGGKMDELLNNIDKFERLDKSIANKLIEKGKGYYVAVNIEKFEESIHRDIAFKLIDSDNSISFIYIFEKFKGLDQEVAFKLIESEQVSCIFNNFTSFKNIDHQKISLKLIETDQGRYIYNNLDKLKNINQQEIAERLTKVHAGYSLAENLDKFKGLDYQLIADKLIEAGHGSHVAGEVENFIGVNHQEFAIKIIEKGSGYAVFGNLEKFKNVDHNLIILKLLEPERNHGCLNESHDKFSKFKNLNNTVALELIKNNLGHLVSRNLDSFDVLDKEVAYKLFKRQNSWPVLHNLDKFSGIEAEEVVAWMIESGDGRDLIAVLEIFKDKDIDHQKIARVFIGSRSGVHYESTLVKNLEKFKNLDLDDIVDRLLKEGEGNLVAENLEKFIGIDHQKLADQLIESYRKYAIADNLEKFEGLDHQKLADQLIESNTGNAVANNLDKFEGVDKKEVAQKLIDSDQLEAVISNIQNFNGLVNRKEIAQQAFDHGLEEYLVKNLKNFKGINHQQTALKLIDLGKTELIINYIDHFSGLDQEIALKLIEALSEKKGSLKFYYLFSNRLEHFKNLDHQIIAQKIIEAGGGDDVSKLLGDLKDLNKTIALKLIDLGKAESVIYYIDKFNNLDQEVVLRLIENKKIRKVIEILDKFVNLDFKEIAISMIENEQGNLIIYFKNKFEDLGMSDKELADRLIEAGYAGLVAGHLKNFQDKNLDYKKLADQLFENDEEEKIAWYLEEFKGLDHQEIADRLLKKGKGRYFAEKLDKFNGLDHQDLANKLYEADQAWVVARNLDNFENIDQQELVDKLLDAGQEKILAENLGDFSELDKEIIYKLIEHEEVFEYSFVNNFEKIKNIDHQKFADMMIEHNKAAGLAITMDKLKGVNVTEIALKLVETKNAEALINNLKNFKGLDNSKILKLLLETHNIKHILSELKNFTDLNKETALMLMEKMNDEIVAKNLKSFKGLDKEVFLKFVESGGFPQHFNNLEGFSGLDQDVALMMIKKELGKRVVENLESFIGLNYQDMALKLIEAGYEDDVLRNLEKFKELDLDFIQSMIEKVIKVDNYKKILEVAKINKLKINKNYYFLDNELGNLLTQDVLPIGIKLVKGELPKEVKELGIKNTGKAGIVELKKVIIEYGKKLVDGDLKLEDFDNEKESLVKSVIRFNDSEWRSEEYELKDLFTQYLSDKEKGLIKPLAKEFKPEKLQIKKLKEVKNIKYSEQFWQKYDTMVNSLLNASEDVETYKNVKAEDQDGRIKKLFKINLDLVTNELEEKIKTQTNPQAAKNIQNRINFLKSIVFKKIRNPQDLIVKLSKESTMQEPLRRLLLFVGIFLNPNLKDRIEKFKNIDKENLTVDTINELIEIIGHVINQETLKKYFTNKQSQNSLKKILDIRSIYEEITRIQDRGTQGVSQFEFVPSRSFVQEMSGYLADACWTSQINLGKTYPNMTSVIFVQNPESDKDRRVAGAGLILETKSKGQGIMIIRGTNPQANVINGLKAEDFMEKYIDYIAEIAKKKKCKKGWYCH